MIPDQDIIDGNEDQYKAGTQLSKLQELVNRTRHAETDQVAAERKLADALETIDTLRAERDKAQGDCTALMNTQRSRHARWMRILNTTEWARDGYKRAADSCAKEEHVGYIGRLKAALEASDRQRKLAEKTLLDIELDHTGSGSLFAGAYFATKRRLEKAREEVARNQTHGMSRDQASRLD